MPLLCFRLGWALLFVGGVLAVFLLTAPERASRRAASETLIQACALDRSAASVREPCAELAQSDPSRTPAGESVWLSQC